MNPNPFTALLHSRKFWIMAWDFAVSIALYFGAKYAGASVFEDIKFLIGILQAPVVTIIYAISHEDGISMQTNAATEIAIANNATPSRG
jgi:hypothetical protein